MPKATNEEMREAFQDLYLLHFEEIKGKIEDSEAYKILYDGKFDDYDRKRIVNTFYPEAYYSKAILKETKWKSSDAPYTSCTTGLLIVSPFSLPSEKYCTLLVNSGYNIFLNGPIELIIEYPQFIKIYNEQLNQFINAFGDFIDCSKLSTISNDLENNLNIARGVNRQQLMEANERIENIQNIKNIKNIVRGNASKLYCFPELFKKIKENICDEKYGKSNELANNYKKFLEETGYCVYYNERNLRLFSKKDYEHFLTILPHIGLFHIEIYSWHITKGDVYENSPERFKWLFCQSNNYCDKLNSVKALNGLQFLSAQVIKENNLVKNLNIDKLKEEGALMLRPLVQDGRISINELNKDDVEILKQMLQNALKGNQNRKIEVCNNLDELVRFVKRDRREQVQDRWSDISKNYEEIEVDIPPCYTRYILDMKLSKEVEEPKVNFNLIAHSRNFVVSKD